MSIILQDFHNLSGIFHSSGNPVREIDYGRIFDYLSTNVMTCTKWGFKKQGRVGLYISLMRWQQDYFKKYEWDDWSRPIETFTHLNRTFDRLQYSVNGAAHGGDAHQKLSRFAALFLIDSGRSVLFEQPLNGCRVDLLSSDMQWVIECGDTNGQPIITHLFDVKRVGVLPFQDLREDSFMYVFERGSNWDSQKILSDFNRNDPRLR